MSPIPCLTPSNVLPFYVTAETGSVECPGFAALSTLLVRSNIDRTCGMYVELRKKTLAAMLCSTKWEEIVARWLFTTHGSLSQLLFEPSPNFCELLLSIEGRWIMKRDLSCSDAHSLLSLFTPLCSALHGGSEWLKSAQNKFTWIDFTNFFKQVHIIFVSSYIIFRNVSN